MYGGIVAFIILVGLEMCWLFSKSLRLWVAKHGGESRFVKAISGEQGAMAGGLIGGIIVAIVLVAVAAKVVVAMWPTLIGANTDIQALTQTDAGTTVMKALSPIWIIVAGAAIGLGVLMYILDRMGILNF